MFLRQLGQYIELFRKYTGIWGGALNADSGKVKAFFCLFSVLAPLVGAVGKGLQVWALKKGK